MKSMINSILIFSVVFAARSRGLAESAPVPNVTQQGTSVDNQALPPQLENKLNDDQDDLDQKNETLGKDSKKEDSSISSEKNNKKESNEATTAGGSLAGLSQRDPFRPPEYIILKVRQKAALAIKNDNVFDESVEPVRRWPLAAYKLVGIIWEVHKPKAMFLDRSNNVHMLQVNDFIGNSKGVVISINSGSVTVLEGKIPQVIKLKK